MNSTGIAIGGLDITFDYIVGLMAPKKVQLTSTQYESFEEMKSDFENTGWLKINVLYSSNTIFGQASTNWQFRAWHDACHIAADADFSPEGEFKAVQLQCKQVLALDGPSVEDKVRWICILMEEVVGQGVYYAEHNDFPVNQRAFAHDFILNRYGLDSELFPKTREDLAKLVVKF